MRSKDYLKKEYFKWAPHERRQKGSQRTQWEDGV